MENVNMVAGMEKVVQEIRAAAILREAGRLAGDNSTNPDKISPTDLQKAVKAYKDLLDEMRRQGL